MITLKALPCRDDNYIWILHDARYAWVVDPSLAEPVRDYIVQNNLILADILITHHHCDHVEGIAGLLPFLEGQVIGSSQRIADLTQRITHPSKLKLSFSNIDVHVLFTPGHTYDHVSYYLPNCLMQPVLCCGDTVFSAGCGRIFDGSIETLFSSFQMIMNLPDSTLIACAHEYTLSNLKFALAIDSSHENTQVYNNRVKYAREHGKPSLPTYLALEKTVNPYMRCIEFEPNWITLLTQFSRKKGITETIQTPFDAFKICRMLKNSF